MSELYEVKITSQAQEQMAEIIDYISYDLCAPEAADSLLNKLENRIMALSKFPERYQLIDEEPWKTEGIRKILVNNFLVYYWIDKAKRVVHVTTVIYEKRNQLEQLKRIIPDS